MHRHEIHLLLSTQIHEKNKIKLEKKAYLTREVADPTSSGILSIKLNDTSNDFSMWSLENENKVSACCKHERERNSKNEIVSNTKRLSIQKTYSPIAAGRWESLLWLTFSTVNRGKFLRSSLSDSILL